MSRWPFLLILIFLTGCGSNVRVPEPETVPPEPIVWPEPPLQPRIKLVRAINNPRDLGIRRPILTRLWEVIVGRKDLGMVRPYGVAVEDERLVITDPGIGVVHLYDLRKLDYERIDRADDQALRSPIGAVFVDGEIFVSDSALGKILVFDSEGKLIRQIDGLKRPTGLAYDAQRGRLYVADTLAHQIIVMNPEGRRLSAIGRRGTADGEFNFPSHLSFRGDRLYVNDTMNFRLQIFDSAGIHISSFGNHGDGSGDFAQPKGIGIDDDGHIYVVDALFHRVQIFDSQGGLLLGFGGPGNSLGEFWLPSGLFIDKNRIYVADSYNRRLQVFEYLEEG